MKKYIKLDENKVITQVQPNKEDGFIETDKDVVCGMIKQGDGSFKAPEPTPPTDDEIRRAAQQEGEVYTLNGEDYQVPFMKDDADGLMQVNAAFQLGITDSVLYFTNGTKMPITAAEFQDFAVWFVTKRNSFFTL